MFRAWHKYSDETTLKLACMDKGLWAKMLLIIIADSHKIWFTASFCHYVLYKHVTFHNSRPLWFGIISCWNLIGRWRSCLLNCLCVIQRICLFLTPRRWKLKCTIFTGLVIWLRSYKLFCCCCWSAPYGQNLMQLGIHPQNVVYPVSLKG